MVWTIHRGSVHHTISHTQSSSSPKIGHVPTVYLFLAYLLPILLTVSIDLESPACNCILNLTESCEAWMMSDTSNHPAKFQLSQPKYLVPM